MASGGQFLDCFRYLCANVYLIEMFAQMGELQAIQNRIYEIRGQRVMLDFDLASIYQVETRALKQAVRRNIERFEGDDFMFELTVSEYNDLKINIRSQFVMSEMADAIKFPTYPPFAFTEIGVAMLSGVLRSSVAVRANRAIMRAFVAMRNYISTTSAVTAELAEIRAKLALLERNDEDNAAAVNDLSEDIHHELETIYEAIAALSIKKRESKRNPIGFKTKE